MNQTTTAITNVSCEKPGERKRFLDMPGLGPLMYLLSAGSITLGAARILAPAFDWDKSAVDTWGQAGIVSTLFAYSLCLMGTLLVIRVLARRLIEQRHTDDTVALLLLTVAFAVAAPASLVTWYVHWPLATAILTPLAGGIIALAAMAILPSILGVRRSSFAYAILPLALWNMFQGSLLAPLIPDTPGAAHDSMRAVAAVGLGILIISPIAFAYFLAKKPKDTPGLPIEQQPWLHSLLFATLWLCTGTHWFYGSWLSIDNFDLHLITHVVLPLSWIPLLIAPSWPRRLTALAPLVAAIGVTALMPRITDIPTGDWWYWSAEPRLWLVAHGITAAVAQRYLKGNGLLVIAALSLCAGTVQTQPAEVPAILLGIITVIGLRGPRPIMWLLPSGVLGLAAMGQLHLALGWKLTQAPITALCGLFWALSAAALIIRSDLLRKNDRISLACIVGFGQAVLLTQFLMRIKGGIIQPSIVLTIPLTLITAHWFRGNRYQVLALLLGSIPPALPFARFLIPVLRSPWLAVGLAFPLLALGPALVWVKGRKSKTAQA